MAPADTTKRQGTKAYDPIGSRLDAAWKGRVALLLGKISSVRGDRALATEYGQSALSVFHSIAGLPNTL